MSNRLKTTMYGVTVYLALLGVLFSFFPTTARSALGIALSDEALSLLYGQVVLALAFMAYLVANNVDSLGKMASGFVALFGGHILVFAYQVFTSVQTFAQVGPPLIISAIFMVLLYSFRNSS